MENKIKNFCENAYNDCVEYGASVNAAIDRCYGAVMFCINNCFDDYNNEIANWWDDEMLPKFKELKSYYEELKHAPAYVNTTGIGAT